MRSTCSHCNQELEPKDECKCPQRCPECRVWIEEEPHHELNCSHIPKTGDIVFKKEEIHIGQKGDTNEDAYLELDYGFYVLFSKYQTNEAVEKVVDKILTISEEYPKLQNLYDMAIEKCKTLKSERDERVNTANKIISEKIDEIKKLKQFKQKVQEITEGSTWNYSSVVDLYEKLNQILEGDTS